ncbi:glycosyltransferase [Bradyrhizobium sp. URHD0069]|uniref:glycosyltransferase n=1 Tax=Bradyrhizobium sp. URHD0069 TaxID=1380355 RepID=UPI00068A545D|nr:glycosyltransferase [Bradyrhizobium sp. URHD0069]
MTRQGARRILFTVGSLTVGGTESQLVMLASGLMARGWTVSVLGLEKSGPLIEKLERMGVAVLDGGYRAAAGLWLKVLLLGLCEIRLFGYALTIRPNVIHGFLPLTNFMSALAGRMAFVPLIITSRRGLGKHQDRHPNLKWLDWIANALSHVVTANSQAVARDTQARDGYDISRIVVIPNGLDFAHLDDARHRRNETRNALGLARTDIAIAMVANLIPYKGHAELIEAFAGNAAGDPRLKLFLIGEDRGLAEDLMSNARRLGVASRIGLMGQRSDVPVLLSAMDVGVLASHEEGFSNALLEKLAAGLPVVATNVGGNSEALKGMPNCFLVEPQDPVDLARGLAEAIGRLGEDDQNGKIRQSRIRERYSVDAMVDAYERLYLRAQ